MRFSYPEHRNSKDGSEGFGCVIQKDGLILAGSVPKPTKAKHEALQAACAERRDYKRHSGQN